MKDRVPRDTDKKRPFGFRTVVILDGYGVFNPKGFSSFPKRGKTGTRENPISEDGERRGVPETSSPTSTD